MAGKKGKKPKKAIGPVKDGIVTRSTGSRCTVTAIDGEVYECVVRGKFRIAGLTSTNPVAVGDKVRFQVPTDREQEPGLIREILPRENYMLRRAIMNTHKVHVLAANIDQAVLLLTLREPTTSMGFADRFLVVAEAYHIPAYIVINKIDLLDTPEEKEVLEAIHEMYASVGYPVLELSALDPTYKAQVEALLKDKVSFIGGHSGSGKSTLINLIDPDLHLKTATISTYSGKGRHTTTYSEMFSLAGGGFIIDSPGIKELGLSGFEKTELSHYFPEMRERLADCKFNDCTHLHEPGCAVLAALKAGEIAESRFMSYLSMFADIEDAGGH